MTEPERIERAWSNVSSLARSSDYCNESDHEDIELIESIVKKEIPKKPIIVPNEFNILSFECPNCHKKTYTNFIRKYCGDCGQKLDWSDFK